MDRALLLQHLAQAERHIVLGEEHLTIQEALIADLEREGHDTEGAKEVLATMLQSQAVHVETRDRILRELNDQGP
jgi:hypothetical protein